MSVVLILATAAATFLSSSSSSLVQAGKVLLGVDVLYRHGDRMPINFYPNDPYKDPEDWPAGAKQLTATGKMQQYNLGQYLRQRYGRILGEKYSEKDIYVRSTDVDRTLMSAQSNLAGLYPPVGDQVWNPDLVWQPIPVHTVPASEDGLIGYSSADCPRYTELLQEASDSPRYREMNRKYKWMYDYVSNHTGHLVSDCWNLDQIYDTLFIENLYNKTLPEWTKVVFPSPMEAVSSFSFDFSSESIEMQRLSAGQLVKQTVHRAQNLSANASAAYKMMMMSSHDITVASLLIAIGCFDPPIAPPYASCIMTEYFRNSKSKELEIRMLYRNQTDREPFVLSVLGCGEYCPASDFERLTREVYLDDWESACHVDDAFTELVTYLSLAITGALFLCLMVAVAISCKRRMSVGGPANYEGLH